MPWYFFCWCSFGLTWKKSHTFTFVTCRSAWQNFVVAVGAEGWFHLFDISADAAKSDSSSQQDGLIGDEQKPSYTQHIPANTKVMLISDIGEKFAYDIHRNFWIFSIHVNNICVVIRWRRALWACRWLHGPGGAGVQVGGTFWCFRLKFWSAGLTKEMASGGSGTELDASNVRSTWSQKITNFISAFTRLTVFRLTQVQKVSLSSWCLSPAVGMRY